jgi:L-fucose isomerase-like protein
MKDARILNVAGSTAKDGLVDHLGTEVRTIPRDRFMEEVRRVGASAEVKELADAYRQGAREIIEPSKTDILDAAQGYFALKRLIETEKADALMMQCLGGLRKPLGGQAAHVPACMGFMSLRDEGIAAGCEADLEATLTMMILQRLFGKPGFQHNPVVDTERNQYLGAHCTCASKLNGVNTPSLPYILRSHNEAGWGCVPQVLMTTGQEFTMAKYLAGETPQMYVYSGTIVGCRPKAASGCRTNVETVLNELDDACDVQGHHLSLIYGNHARQLRAFCQLHGIEVLV